MPTEHGIEASRKWWAGTRRMTTLSDPESVGGDNDLPYLQCLRRSNEFVQAQCKEAFIRLREYLASPPVLCKLQPSTPLRLYIAVADQAITTV